MLPPCVYTSCTMKSRSGVWIMEQLCLQQCTQSACMTGNDQSHKSKKLLNSFGFRVGHIIRNSHLFACSAEVKQIVNAKYRGVSD